VSQKIHYLIYCNLTKPEPIVVILAQNILIILASKSIYNFTSNLTFVLLCNFSGWQNFFHTALLPVCL